MTRARAATLIVLAALALAGLERAWQPPDAGASPADRLGPYRGLGTWVDIYDSSPYDRPREAVRKMAENNVDTLYLETANYRIDTKIHRPADVGRLIEAAHRRGIRVVAWYLPSYARPKRDFRRSMAAIRFRTDDGQRFDSFALDIESTEVRDIEVRNRRVRRLARRLRDVVGEGKTMGAIVPEANALYWPDFPYRAVANNFDVFLPMAYFTYRTSGFDGVDTFITNNIRAIRRATRDPAIPIHVIGGVAQDATLRETRAYVKAVVDLNTIGGGLYDFTTTTAGQWERLQQVPR